MLTHCAVDVMLLAGVAGLVMGIVIGYRVRDVQEDRVYCRMRAKLAGRAQTIRRLSDQVQVDRILNSEWKRDLVAAVSDVRSAIQEAKDASDDLYNML